MMKKITVTIAFLLLGILAFSQETKLKSTFVTDSLFFQDSLLCWETTKENGALSFHVEQYLWGKWTKVGEVMGIGTPGVNKYSYEVVLHSGENFFRVTQYDWTGRPRITPRLVVANANSPVTYTYMEKSVTFSRKTIFELWQGEKLVSSGQGTEINVAGLPRATYTLKYDNQVQELQLK